MAPPVDRIATAFLKTAAENLLSLVPVVGPFLDFGVGLAQHLVDEFAGEILALEPRDGRAVKAQRFIDRRTGRRRLLPRLVTAFVVGALVAAAVPVVGHAHQVAVAGSAPWHHADGSYCSPYLTSP